MDTVASIWTSMPPLILKEEAAHLIREIGKAKSQIKVSESLLNVVISYFATIFFTNLTTQSVTFSGKKTKYLKEPE